MPRAFALHGWLLHVDVHRLVVRGPLQGRGFMCVVVAAAKRAPPQGFQGIIVLVGLGCCVFIVSADAVLVTPAC